jgi:hypothetical protein
MCLDIARQYAWDSCRSTTTGLTFRLKYRDSGSYEIERQGAAGPFLDGILYLSFCSIFTGLIAMKVFVVAQILVGS